MSIKVSVRLKQLQAQIDGMRLALSTSCTSCEVEAVVNLLKTINQGVTEALQLLEPPITEPAEVAEETSDTQLADESEPTPEEYVHSEMYKQLGGLLDSAVANTSVIPETQPVQTDVAVDSESIDQDIEALHSLMGALAAKDQANADSIQLEKDSSNDTQSEQEEVSVSDIKDIRHLATQPIHFETPMADPGDFNRDEG